MSDTATKKVNAQALLEYLERLDAEIAELEKLVSELEAKINEFKQSGKPNPELPSLIIQLEDAKNKLGDMRKRRSELSVLAFNQALLEKQQIEQSLTKKITNSIDFDELRKLYLEFFRNCKKSLLKVVDLFEKKIGVKLYDENSDDVCTIQNLMILGNNAEQNSFTQIEGAARLFVQGLLNRHFARTMMPYQNVAQRCKKESGLSSEALKSKEVNLPVLSYEPEGGKK